MIMMIFLLFFYRLVGLFNFIRFWIILVHFGGLLIPVQCALSTLVRSILSDVLKKSATIQVEHDFRSEVFKFQKPRDSHSKVLFQKLNLLLYLKGLTWRQRGPHMLYKYFYCWLILQ